MTFRSPPDAKRSDMNESVNMYRKRSRLASEASADSRVNSAATRGVGPSVEARDRANLLNGMRHFPTAGSSRYAGGDSLATGTTLRLPADSCVALSQVSGNFTRDRTTFPPAPVSTSQFAWSWMAPVGRSLVPRS